MKAIQDVRDKKSVPNGRPLHDYANLYFDARNPMMSSRRSVHEEMCVLRVDPVVLDIHGTVVTDQNARSDYARFAPAPGGLVVVDDIATFARDWRAANTIAYWRKKSRKMAEVLVPDRVPAQHIKGAFVSNAATGAAVGDLATNLPLKVEPDMFFQDEGDES